MANQDFSYQTDVLGQVISKGKFKTNCSDCVLGSQRSLTDIFTMHVDLCAIMTGIVNFRLQKRLKNSRKLKLIENLLKQEGKLVNLRSICLSASWTNILSDFEDKFVKTMFQHPTVGQFFVPSAP